MIKTKIDTTAGSPPRPARDLAIQIEDLHKSYGDHTVLTGIDLEVPTGSVYALLGPNGAGKTTTVQIASTLLESDGGRVTVAGSDVDSDPQSVRNVIGVTGQFAAVDEILNGRENLQLMAALRHLPRAQRRTVPDRLLEQFDLVDAATKPVSSYSGGMRRRLDLAMTLVGEPKIIFLDEPTTGLDPRSRRTMWELVRGLVRQGTTILLTTQYLGEADQLADRIGVLDNGKIVADGTAEELKRMVPGGHIRLRFADVEQSSRATTALVDATSQPDELVVELPTDGSTRSIRTVLDALDRSGLEPEEFSIHTPDLDDVFLALTGHPTESSADADSTPVKDPS